MTVRNLLVALLCAVVLAACAPVPRKPLEAGLAESQRKLLDLPYWRFEGRVAVQTRAEGLNASLFWEHDGRQDRVRLSGPFSQGAVSIVLQDDLIYINEGNGVVRTSRDPDELLRQRLGFTVPLANLRYWVLGLPAPRGEPANMAVSGAADRSFDQQGYALAFERFIRVREFDLPQKMSAQGAELKLKLIVDEWVLN